MTAIQPRKTWGDKALQYLGTFVLVIFGLTFLGWVYKVLFVYKPTHPQEAARISAMIDSMNPPRAPVPADELSAGIIKDLDVLVEREYTAPQPILSMRYEISELRMKWIPQQDQTRRLKLWYEPPDYRPTLYTRTDCDAPSN